MSLASEMKKRGIENRKRWKRLKARFEALPERKRKAIIMECVLRYGGVFRWFDVDRNRWRIEKEAARYRASMIRKDVSGVKRTGCDRLLNDVMLMEFAGITREAAIEFARLHHANLT